jgi:NitT/TauT family transport system permease protein
MLLRVASRLNFYVPVVLALALWEAASRAGLIDPTILPSFSDVLVGFGRLLTTNKLLQHCEISLFRQMSGFLLAGAVGIVCGILMATSGWARFAIEPIIKLTYPLPKSALIPLFILWLGIGDASKIGAVFLGSLLPVVLSTYNSARGINVALTWSAWSLGTPRWLIPWKVVLPAALPEILSGLRIALALSFTLMVSAEFLISQSGLGYLISQLGENGDYAGMFAAVMAVTLIGVAADRSFLWLSRWLLRWTEQQ